MKLPLGYAYSAVYAGIRAVEKDDLSLIVSGLPANAAAVFTQNRVQAAPVKLSRRNMRLSRGKVGALLINAGNAATTGVRVQGVKAAGLACAVHSTDSMLTRRSGRDRLGQRQHVEKQRRINAICYG